MAGNFMQKKMWKAKNFDSKFLVVFLLELKHVKRLVGKEILLALKFAVNR